MLIQEAWSLVQDRSPTVKLSNHEYSGHYSVAKYGISMVWYGMVWSIGMKTAHRYKYHLKVWYGLVYRYVYRPQSLF